MHRSLLANIIIDCNDVELGAKFWSEAFGAEIVDRDPPYIFLEQVSGLFVGLQGVPEPKAAKGRLHLDISTDNIEAEVARLENLGAKRIEKIEGWWVMQDPCGNEFCVIRVHRPDFDQLAKTWE